MKTMSRLITAGLVVMAAASCWAQCGESPSLVPRRQSAYPVDQQAQEDGKGYVGWGTSAAGAVGVGAVAYGASHWAANKSAAVAGSTCVIPGTLGQTWVLGPTVAAVPVVGNVLTAPARPWAVTAVAIDTYYLPKFAPCGYTESSMFTNTDFNSAPRLRGYVNYLAPQPYTHPPIYAPGPVSGTIGDTQQPVGYDPFTKRPVVQGGLAGPAETVSIDY